MPNATRDQLFRLIKSLTKAEKRNFRLYANRSGSSGTSKFVQLFDVIDKAADYSEEWLQEKMGTGNRAQLASLKRNLHRQILASLRLIYIQKQVDLQIREQVDFARILYSKGLYMDALRMLEKTKPLATEHNQDILHLEILEFQKLIETRHITRSRQVDAKMDQLLQESAQLSAATLATSEMSNVNIKIHGYYIENGHARTPARREEARQYWESIQPALPPPESGENFLELVNRRQSEMWYHYILLDFDRARQAAAAWTTLYDSNEKMRAEDPDLYMRGMYYLLVFHYLLGDVEGYLADLDRFERFIDREWDNFNPNSHNIGFVYLELSRLNRFLLQRDFTGALREAARIERALQRHHPNMDEHRRMLFEYKFAYACFARGKYDRALDYLNDILNEKGVILRDDLHIHTRLLHCLCHFQLDNLGLVDYHLTNTRRLLRRSPEAGQIHFLTVELLRQLLRSPRPEQAAIFRQREDELAALAKDPFEQKVLLYLDLHNWIRSRLQNPSMRTAP